MDRTAYGVQAALRKSGKKLIAIIAILYWDIVGQNTVRESEGDLIQGEQRPGRQVPSDCLRRCSWSVPRPDGTLQDWR